MHDINDINDISHPRKWASVVLVVYVVQGVALPNAVNWEWPVRAAVARHEKGGIDP